jgi:hypothetical protein
MYTPLFKFEHPIHGPYYVWFIDNCYGISKTENKPFCAYSSLSALFKAKGL